jgi:branched-chain amino acid transport system permease protein
VLALPVLIVAVQLVVFPMPDALLLEGVTLGLLGALVAVGMALVYRTNRVLNFAQGDLGVLPAMLSVILIQSFTWNWFVGVATGLVVALVLGALVEAAIIRRFFKAPRLILTVATIGLAQLLAAITVLLPRWLAWATGRDDRDVTVFAERISFPWHVRLVREPLIFDGDHVVAWIVAPLALLAVALFLRFTSAGVAIRGSAENPVLAGLLGVPVARLHTYVWSLAAALSFVGLVLRAGIVGIPTGVGSSLTALLLALAALTLGRMSNLPAVAVSAVALGLLEEGLRWHDEAQLVAPILGLVIVVALVAQRVGTTRAEQDASSEWEMVQDVREVPRELRGRIEVRAARAVGATLAVAGLLVLPQVLDASSTLKAAAVAIYAIITLSVVVLSGWAGQVSLGQMGFVGIGGAVGAVATGQWGLDLTLALLVAGVVGALVATAVGLPALRLRGLHLAVVTLAFGLATTAYFLNNRFFGWVPDESTRIARPPLFGRLDIDSPAGIYYVCLAGLAFTFFLAHGVRHSRTGRVLVALRENERAAQAFGVDVTRAKLTAFALSGFLAAFAGALLVHHQQAFSLTLVAPEQNLVVFTGAAIGGSASMLGAVLGALYLQGGRWFLPEELQVMSTSVGVLVVLLVLPGGLGGAVYRGRDLWLGWVARRAGPPPGHPVGTVDAALAGDRADTGDAVEPVDGPVEAVGA